MDLIGQYSDSDAEDQEPSPEPSPGSAARPSRGVPAPQLRNAAPDDQDAGSSHHHHHHHHHHHPAAPPPAPLLNPFAPPDAERPASNASASSSGGGGKRGFVQVTGTGPMQAAPPKSSRSAANPAGPNRPAFNSALLVPPQLRNGRANIATEDVEKIFTKGSLAKRRPK